MLIILVNKKRILKILLLIVVVLVMVWGYKPYLRKFEYPLKYSEYVTASAGKYGVDPYLIYSIIKAESKFDEDAISSKEAQGLMQITPQTAQWAMDKMGLSSDADIFSPDVNIEVGSWYIAKLLYDHDNNLTAALAAYNAGSTNVNEWKNENGDITLEDIRFEETYDYVSKTLEYYENYKKLYPKGEIK